MATVVFSWRWGSGPVQRDFLSKRHHLDAKQVVRYASVDGRQWDAYHERQGELELAHFILPCIFLLSSSTFLRSSFLSSSFSFISLVLTLLLLPSLSFSLSSFLAVKIFTVITVARCSYIRALIPLVRSACRFVLESLLSDWRMIIYSIEWSRLYVKYPRSRYDSNDTVNKISARLA